ncbi:MAG: tetratricopeptide repeat protein [Candidatus Sumerlaeaceae bacterium]|nr:tetratricopeptide repeat protein [Candidatus Sumerlaeaceae bacterium]
MRQLKVPLKDVIVDFDSEVDLSAMPASQAKDHVQGLYSFLPERAEVQIEGDTVVISFPELKPGKQESGTKAYKQGLDAAAQGNYIKAIDLFQRSLRDLPDYIDARRNLAMAYLEAGNVPSAKKHLLELFRLTSRDQWGLLLAANLFAKHENNLPLAAKFYNKAYTIDPTDPYILTSYAALLSEMGDDSESQSMYEEAISASPEYPNPYFGLALLFLKQSKFNDVLNVLDRMFAAPASQDPRSTPVYNQGRQLFSRIYEIVAGTPPPGSAGTPRRAARGRPKAIWAPH